MEFDEVVMERYLAGEVLAVDEVKRAIRAGTIALKINPVFCGSAFKNKGVQPLLDGVVDYLPSPVDLPPVVGIDPHTEGEISRKPENSEPFAALAFKIMSDPFSGQLTYFRVYSGKLIGRILCL